MQTDCCVRHITIHGCGGDPTSSARPLHAALRCLALVDTKSSGLLGRRNANAAAEAVLSRCLVVTPLLLPAVRHRVRQHAPHSGTPQDG